MTTNNNQTLMIERWKERVAAAKADILDTKGETVPAPIYNVAVSQITGSIQSMEEYLGRDGDVSYLQDNFASIFRNVGSLRYNEAFIVLQQYAGSDFINVVSKRFEERYTPIIAERGITMPLVA